MFLSAAIVIIITLLLIRRKYIGWAISLLICSLFFYFAFVITNSELARISSYIFSWSTLLSYLLFFHYHRKISLFGLVMSLSVIFNIVVINNFLNDANNYIKESDITFLLESDVYDEYLEFLSIAGYEEQDLKTYNQEQIALMQTTINEMNVFEKIEYYFFIQEQTNQIVADFQPNSTFETTINTSIEEFDKLSKSDQEVYAEALKETFGDYNE